MKTFYVGSKKYVLHLNKLWGNQSVVDSDFRQVDKRKYAVNFQNTKNWRGENLSYSIEQKTDYSVKRSFEHFELKYTENQIIDRERIVNGYATKGKGEKYGVHEEDLFCVVLDRNLKINTVIDNEEVNLNKNSNFLYYAIEHYEKLPVTMLNKAGKQITRKVFEESKVLPYSALREFAEIIWEKSIHLDDDSIVKLRLTTLNEMFHCFEPKLKIPIAPRTHPHQGKRASVLELVYADRLEFIIV